ncbi:MAG: hypothetical protein JOY94_18540, partial [Methylobacteriaceae bacterium]|nr:hypothetical protein [Methylobacteriaceae bacterium]
MPRDIPPSILHLIDEHRRWLEGRGGSQLDCQGHDLSELDLSERDLSRAA